MQTEGDATESDSESDLSDCSDASFSVSPPRGWTAANNLAEKVLALTDRPWRLQDHVSLCRLGKTRERDVPGRLGGLVNFWDDKIRCGSLRNGERFASWRGVVRLYRSNGCIDVLRENGNVHGKSFYEAEEITLGGRVHSTRHCLLFGANPVEVYAGLPGEERLVRKISPLEVKVFEGRRGEESLRIQVTADQEHHFHSGTEKLEKTNEDGCTKFFGPFGNIERTLYRTAEGQERTFHYVGCKGEEVLKNVVTSDTAKWYTGARGQERSIVTMDSKATTISSWSEDNTCRVTCKDSGCTFFYDAEQVLYRRRRAGGQENFYSEGVLCKSIFPEKGRECHYHAMNGQPVPPRLECHYQAMNGQPVLVREESAKSTIYYYGSAFEEIKHSEVMCSGEVSCVVFGGERGAEIVTQKHLRSGEKQFFAPDGSLERREDKSGCRFFFAGKRGQEQLVTSLDAQGYVTFSQKRPRVA